MAADMWRLFVADHAEPVVSALDLETGALLDTFRLDAPATLYATASRAAVFAVQGAADKVVPIRTGITVDDHGEHSDLRVEPPALVDAPLTGDRPVHFVEHHGQLAVFFDGEGTARMIEERDWLDGKVTHRALAAAAPHHGVAVGFDSLTLLSVPHETDPEALPIGMQFFDAAGSPVGDLHACPDLHGEATSGNILAIACSTGLLIVKEQDSRPQITFLPYAEDLADGKATTLLGGVGLQYFLGNFGPDRVVLIDPAAASAFRLVDLPTRRVHFAVNPVDVRFAYVFTEDGILRELDVVAGELTRELRVTAPYSMDGEWNLPRPRIAVAGGQIAISDPLAGAVHLVDAKSFTALRQIAVEGSPFNVIAVGGSGETHTY
jgi:hypothetical protein